MNLAFWAAFISSLACTPFIYRMLLATNTRQVVSEFVPEHQSKQGTPTMGGLIVVIGLLVSGLLIGAQWNWILLVAGFAAIGFVDDYVIPRVRTGRRGLGWSPKLVAQFAVAVPSAILWGMHDPVQVIVFSIAVVGFSNAYNFSDGMDCLAGGLGVLFALCVAALCLLTGFGQPGLCVSVVGAILPFLFLNAPPARVFMGDVGSLPIGAALGALLVTSAPIKHGPLGWWLISALLLSLVFAVELIPVPLQILSVKLRGKRMFPMTPIHHAFQAAGWPETRVVAAFHLAQVACGIGALSMYQQFGLPTLHIPVLGK